MSLIDEVLRLTILVLFAFGVSLCLSSSSELVKNPSLCMGGVLCAYESAYRNREQMVSVEGSGRSSGVDDKENAPKFV